jgi:RNA polymerase sigma-54 factor
VLVQDKITAAKNFINTINMRTLAMRNVGKLIVQKQRAFFINDDDESLLTPMKLNDIAEALGIHVSTVSRLVRNKYLQTAYGTYPLKKFFSTSFVSQKGEEQSALLTRLKMEELIAGEDKRKPLSDEQIAAAMTELGFPLARRTVAKYREQLGIPEKRIRKIS